MQEAQPSTSLSTLRIAPLHTPDDMLAFRTLNEGWITEFFTLEDTDRQQLGDPLGVIVRPGGQIFMAHLNGRPVGCVALRPSGEGEFEISKMAVASELRGQGIGRRLLSHTIDQARLLGACRLMLGSSTRLESAVHLYERLGFQHVPVERRPVSPYARADVFMELDL